MTAEQPRTKAGRRLLGHEAYNSRSFSLITAEDVRAVEDEAAGRAAWIPCEHPDHRELARLTRIETSARAVVGWWDSPIAMSADDLFGLTADAVAELRDALDASPDRNAEEVVERLDRPGNRADGRRK